MDPWLLAERTVEAAKWAATPITWMWRKLRATPSGQVAIPSKTLRLIPLYDRNGIWWHLGDVAGRPAMQVTCHFHATNISTMNVLVAATRLRRPQTIGRALTKNENGNVFGEFMIPIGNISEVVCHYWIQPPVRDEGKSFRADVVIVDSFGNEHIVKNVEFPYR